MKSRIVDFLGQEKYLSNSVNQIIGLLKDRQAEYIDFYQYGLNELALEKAFFRNKNQNEGLIVPNYFEPFENRNIEINYNV